MKSTISHLMLAVMLSLTISNSSCASLPLDSPPRLENRTLRISPDFAGFEYQYKVCVSKFLGICTKKEMKVDKYDLTDPEMRKKLLDMGFVLKVRDKP